MNRPRLLIDLGNSRLKWTLADGEDIGAVHAIGTWRKTLRQLLGQWRALEPAGVVLASVAEPRSHERLLAALTGAGWPIRLARVQARWRGLRCAYAQPERLGVDRWLALIAAHHDAPRRHQLVASAGSALTLDRLLPGGVHAGGLIVPGLHAMRAGLFAVAPGLAAHADGVARDQPARTSADAIASGVLQATVAVIERNRRAHAHARYCRLLLAGGDARLLEPWLSPPLVLRPNLVLEGLALWSSAR